MAETNPSILFNNIANENVTHSLLSWIRNIAYKYQINVEFENMAGMAVREKTVKLSHPHMPTQTITLDRNPNDQLVLKYEFGHTYVDKIIDTIQVIEDMFIDYYCSLSQNDWMIVFNNLIEETITWNKKTNQLFILAVAGVLDSINVPLLDNKAKNKAISAILSGSMSNTDKKMLTLIDEIDGVGNNDLTYALKVRHFIRRSQDTIICKYTTILFEFKIHTDNEAPLVTLIANTNGVEHAIANAVQLQRIVASTMLLTITRETEEYDKQ